MVRRPASMWVVLGGVIFALLGMREAVAQVAPLQTPIPSEVCATFGVVFGVLPLACEPAEDPPAPSTTTTPSTPVDEGPSIAPTPTERPSPVELDVPADTPPGVVAPPIPSPSTEVSAGPVTDAAGDADRELSASRPVPAALSTDSRPSVLRMLFVGLAIAALAVHVGVTSTPRRKIDDAVG